MCVLCVCVVCVYETENKIAKENGMRNYMEWNVQNGMECEWLITGMSPTCPPKSQVMKVMLFKLV